MKTNQLFEPINRGYNHVFRPRRLSIGVVVPIENYANRAVPCMQQHLERVQLVEQLGFSALWVRDVPLHLPAFGDAGQTFDPFTYLGYLAGQTKQIALGAASIALPLRHPVHTVKSAASIDQLSGGRLLLGVASGDRLEEYPAMGIDYEQRGERFRDAFAIIRQAQSPFPALDTQYFGQLNGLSDILPKAYAKHLPLLITGNSRQSLAWNAEYGNGWIAYPRDIAVQQQIIKQWRDLVLKISDYDKPFMQPLYVDLQSDADFPAQPIHLGLRTGVNYLINYLSQLQVIGVNHVALNLRFNSADVVETLHTLSETLLPHFHFSED